MDVIIFQPMSALEAQDWKARVGSTASVLRNLLSDGYERQAWKALGFDTWSDCLTALADEYDLTERRLWQLHSANQTQKLLNHGSVEEIPERQLRPLAPLSPDLQREAWREAVDTAPNGKVTAAHVQAVVDRMTEPEPAHYELYDEGGGQQHIVVGPDEEIAVVKMAHVGQNSGNNEWYTPAEYIEAARAVMGGIDLDPASTEVANTVVQASKFYTVDDNGLLYDWHGRVFMNPPYSQPVINDFANRLAEEYRAGHVTVAIVLVNNATETGWFQTLIDCASAVCFPSGRVKFWSPDRLAAPLQGQALLYLGEHPDTFIGRFIGFGWCAEVA